MNKSITDRRANRPPKCKVLRRLTDNGVAMQHVKLSATLSTQSKGLSWSLVFS